MKKRANVSTAGGTITAPGSSNMPGGGYTQAGAASIPGMSVHCLACGCKLKENKGRCPKCNYDTRVVAKAGVAASEAGIGRAADDSEVSDTGADAAVAEQKAEGQSASDGKYAAVKAVTDFAKSMVGGGAMGVGLIGAAKVIPFKRKMDRDAQLAEVQRLVEEGKLPESELQKFSAARFGNPILRIRMAKKALANASKKSRLSLVKKAK